MAVINEYKFVGLNANTDNTLNPEAAGVDSVEALRNLQLERAKNLYKS